MSDIQQTSNEVDQDAPAPEPTRTGKAEPARPRRRTWRERLDSGSESGSDSEGAGESAVDREHHARQE